MVVHAELDWEEPLLIATIQEILQEKTIILDMAAICIVGLTVYLEVGFSQIVIILVRFLQGEPQLLVEVMVTRTVIIVQEQILMQ